MKAVTGPESVGAKTGSGATGAPAPHSKAAVPRVRKHRVHPSDRKPYTP